MTLKRPHSRNPNLSKLLKNSYSWSFTEETEADKITEDIVRLIDDMGQVANCFWQLVDIPDVETPKTTVEEHLAVLRRISEIVKPYTGEVVFPIPQIMFLRQLRQALTSCLSGSRNCVMQKQKKA